MIRWQIDTQFTLCSGEGGTIRKRRETGWALGAEGGHKVKIIIGKIHEVDMELFDYREGRRSAGVPQKPLRMEKMIFLGIPAIIPGF